MGLEAEFAETKAVEAGYRSILCAVEPHIESELLISLAGSLRVENSQLHIVTVIGEDEALDASSETTTYQSCIAHLEEKVRFCLGREAAEIHVAHGQPRRALLEVAKDVAADLVVMGTRAGTNSAFMLGSTANHALHFANCDVLVVRLHVDSEKQSVAERYRHIAVSLDGHHTVATHLMGRASLFADKHSVYLLNVLRLNDCLDKERIDAGCVEEAYFRSEAQMKAYGERFAIPEEQLKLVVGSFVDSLRTLSAKNDVSLFVLGRHRDGQESEIPVDALSAALSATDADILVVS